jgi:hypothetical protein
VRATEAARCSPGLPGSSGVWERTYPEICAAPQAEGLDFPTMDRLLTRRSFIAGGATVAGALAVPARLLAGPKTTDVYKLDTGCGHGSCACNACFYHDMYSLFPSWKAANGNRAHIGCNCLIKKGSLDYGTYVALFGNPAHLRSYRADTRWTWVQAILKQHPPKF